MAGEGGITKAKVDAVKLSTDAIAYMCDVASKVPKHGGWLQAITGDNSLTAFATELDDMAPKLINYANTMANQMGEEQYAAIKASFDTISYMADTANKIPPTDGLVSLWSGFNGLDNFTGQLVKVSGDLVECAKKIIKDMPENGFDAIDNTLVLIRKFVNYADYIQAKELVSETFNLFPDFIKNIGESFSTYYNKIKGIDLTTFENAITSMKKFVDFAKYLDDVDFTNLNSFGAAFKNVADMGINKFIKAFEDSNETAKEKAENFVEKAKQGAESKETVLKNTFEAIAKACIKPFTGEQQIKNEFKSAGEAAMTNLKTGIDNGGSSAKTVCATIALDCAQVIKDKHGDFWSAGKYVVTGFVGGINNGTKTLSSASIKLANTTRDAIKKALDINSPSRVMYGLGEYTGQGFVNALLDYCDVAGKAGYEMADSAKDGLNNAIRSIQDFIDGKISDQPTIRPVLDLSDIESGARQINGMFSARQAVALASSGPIGIQNGSSGYVINMTINGAPGQDVNQLADLVSERINNSIQRRNNVWR